MSQPTTSRQAEVSLRETCASIHPHPGNIWLSVSPLPLSLFCKLKSSFPPFCHPNVGGDISLPFTCSRHAPYWNSTLRAATSDSTCGDGGHCSILGLCSRCPNKANCLWDA